MPDAQSNPPASSARKTGAALDGLGALALLAFAFLAVISWRPQGAALSSLFIVLGVAWLAVLLAWRLAARLPESALIRKVWFWAVLLRIAGFCGQPVLEDDYWRYLWDGREFALTGNPYAGKPVDHFHDPSVPENFQRVLDNINHPDIPTIYGPGCELAFLVSYWIAPGQLWPLKLILILADLVTLQIVFRMASARNALLYAWCPLLIQETAFTAHPDSLAILFAVGALAAVQGRRWVVASICLGLAVSTRVFAWLLVPYLLWQLPRKHWLVFGGTFAMLNVPFWMRGTLPGLEGTSAFLQGWEFNATAFAAVQWLAGPFVAKGLCAAAFLAAYAGIFRQWWQSLRDSASKSQPAPGPRGDLIFGGFFLLSAVVNPWYLLWLLPFVAKKPTAAGIVSLTAVSLSYAHGLHLADANLASYQVAPWVRPAEIGAVVLAVFWDCRRRLLDLIFRQTAG